MHIRSITRWTLAFLLTLAALIVTLTALNHPRAQAHRLNSLIPCSGSIQACIDSAIDGDTIVIAAGDYTESLTLNKAVSLTGVDSATTILHAMPNDRVLTVTGELITNSTIISSLTFTDGNLAGGVGCPLGCGGGILITESARPLIHNIIVINNNALSGGGIYARDPIVIDNSSVLDNVAGQGDGGGLFASSATTLTNIDFISNTANSGSGGGAYISGTVTLEHVHFNGNTAIRYGGYGGYGGGLFAQYAWSISGTIFTDNTAAKGGGMCAREMSFMTNSIFIGNSAYAGGGGIIATSNNATIANTLFARNTPPAIYLDLGDHARIVHTTIISPTRATDSAIKIFYYSDNAHVDVLDSIIANQTTGIDDEGFTIKYSGTITEDYNLFYGNLINTTNLITPGKHSLVGDPKFIDPLNDDYHLGFGSAAINKGTKVGITTDLDGHRRDNKPDIGAYELFLYRRYFPIIYKQ